MPHFVRLDPTTLTVAAVIDLDDDQYQALNGNPKQAFVRPLVTDDQPVPSATQYVTDAGYVIEPDRVRRTWALVDKTPEQTAAERRITVTPRQIRQALHAAGLLEEIEAGVAAADRSVQIWWEWASSFESDHPVLAQMAPALGLSEAQVRDVFETARTL